MSFDIASLLDASHLVTFLGGTIVGAAGTYMADRFTDRRREKEAASKNKKQFMSVRNQMPELIAEIKEDLSKHQNELVREFVVVANERIMVNHDRPRFQYFENRHSGLKNKVQVLVEAGYVRGISTTRLPIYRMYDHFVAFVNET